MDRWWRVPFPIPSIITMNRWRVPVPVPTSIIMDRWGVLFPVSRYHQGHGSRVPFPVPRYHLIMDRCMRVLFPVLRYLIMDSFMRVLFPVLRYLIMDRCMRVPFPIPSDVNKWVFCMPVSKLWPDEEPRFRFRFCFRSPRDMFFFSDNNSDHLQMRSSVSGLRTVDSWRVHSSGLSYSRLPAWTL
jgi:hypothetical protein